MKGFTLIEVVAIAVVVGLLAALGIPSFSSYLQRQQLNATAEAVASDLRRAQQRARNGGVAVPVAFNSDSYTIGDTTTALPMGVMASPEAIAYNSRGFPDPDAIPFQVRLQAGELSRCIDLNTLIGSIQIGDCGP